MTVRAICLALCLLVAGCGGSPVDAPAGDNAAETGNAVRAAAPEPLPDTVRVRLQTDDGPIVLALDSKHAPITTANFVRYVEEHRFDGTSFYRAARTKGAPKKGFIQGGIRREYRRMLPPIAHEPTSKTGLKHGAGTISMARSDTPGVGAMGDFFILASAMPSLDASADDPGYAAFGRVVEGMDIVRRILAAETVPNAGRGAMRDQMIAKPVKIASAVREPQ
jgi:peptidyl-prolyl cis-trans isomerase A (cyclophilin A)